MRRFGTVAVVLLLAVVLSGCAAYRTHVTTIGEYDPGKELNYDSALWPGIEASHWTSTICTDTPEFGSVEDVCRVMDGYEEAGDYRNYVIDCGVPPADPNCTIVRTGNSLDPWGENIVMQDGTAYEGCYWQSPTNDFYCDYRARSHVVRDVGGSGWSVALRKFWDWFHYGGNAAGCAAGVAGILAGQGVITWPLIVDCDSGPM